MFFIFGVWPYIDNFLMLIFLFFYVQLLKRFALVGGQAEHVSFICTEALYQ